MLYHCATVYIEVEKKKDLEMYGIYNEECVSQIFGQRKVSDMEIVRWEKMKLERTV